MINPLNKFILLISIVIVMAISYTSSARSAFAQIAETPITALEGSPHRVRPNTSLHKFVNEAYLADFQKIWETVRDHFYDKRLNGVDWNRIGDVYRARLGDVKTKAEFEQLMNQMLDELHASHTAYSTDEDIEYYMLPAVMAGDLRGHQVEHIGVVGKQVGHEYVVAAVLDGGPAQHAGILAGDRLLTADGQLFTSAGSFKDKDGQPVRIDLLRNSEGDSRKAAVHMTMTVTPVKQNILRAFLDATEKSEHVISVSGKKLGYVHLWTMANEAFRYTLDNLVLGKLHDTDGLILDLRDGYGGTPFGFSNVFFQPDIAWEQQGHNQNASTRYLGYGKPMVVLINGGTRSAKEFLSYQFKVSHRAVILGTRTAGAFLGAGSYEIGKDGLLELAVVGLKLDGNRLEDVGVSPDITVVAEYPYTERDRQVLRAEQKLLEMVQRRPESLSKTVVH